MMEKLQGMRVKMAAAKYGNPSRTLKIIAVAGPYGKTTVIRFLEGMLKESGKRVATMTNEYDASYDKSIDAFFRLLAEARKQRCDFVIVEISESLEKSGVLKQLLLDSLIITGENGLTEPLLSLQPKHVVVPSGLEVPNGTVEPYQHISFGDDELAEAKIDNIKLYKNGSELTITIDHQTKLELATYLVGTANTKCLAIAVAAAYVLGMKLDALQEGIADIQPFAGRFERIRETDLLTIIDVGTRNESVSQAVESAKQLTHRRLIIAVDNEVASSEYTSLQHVADRLFAVSDGASLAATTDTVSSVHEAVEKAKRAAKPGDIVLLIGPGFMANARSEEI